MSTSKILATPQIISLVGSTLRVKHPDISGYTRTTLTAPFTATGTTLTVRDNNNFSDDDWFILGEIGNSKTEECDVNDGSIARGTSITITNSTKFNHELDTPVTRIFERAVKIYGASTDGGSGTLIASVDAITASTNQLADSVMIQWDKDFTEYTLISSDTAYTYYYVTFYDGTTESSASDYVLATGLAYNTARTIVQSGLNLARAEVDGKLITWEFLLDCVNDFQDQVTHYVTPSGQIKNWPFEMTEDKTSLTLVQNQDSYAVSGLSSTMKYPDSYQGIIQVKLGAAEIDLIDLDEWERLTDGNVRTQVDTEAAAAATSIILDDVSEFADSGSFYLSTQSAVVTYTDRDTTTNTLSGIPSSGTGSITATATVDAIVWQNVTPGKPDRFTLFNDQFLLNIPPDSDTAGKKLKVKYYYALSRLTSLSETMVIPFTHIGKYYIAAQIEYRKKNSDNGDRYTSIFERELAKEASKYMEHMEEVTYYYDFVSHLR